MHGKCQCACRSGYITPANLKGYSDCGVKMDVQGSVVAAVTALQQEREHPALTVALYALTESH